MGGVPLPRMWSHALDPVLTSILGIDLSSTQLDGCLLVDGQPPVLRRETLGKATEPLIERIRRVQNAMDSLITDETSVQWPLSISKKPVPDWIVIEDAYGPSGKARKALDLVVGAIIASCPSESQVALVRCADWRRALGAKNTKAEGHVAVYQALLRNRDDREFDEHELDAIGIALAWQRILASNEAAA
jgi:hypothetical protein